MVWFRPLLPRQQPEVQGEEGKCRVSIVRPGLRRLILGVVQQIAQVIGRCQPLEDRVGRSLRLCIRSLGDHACLA